MLADQLGIRLVLWMGNTLPLPAPYDVITALQKVEVTSDATQGDGFQLTFSMAKGISDYSVLASGSLDAFTRVVIGVALGVVPEVLIDGVITNHEITPSETPGQSTITVTGKDVSLMMDLEEKNADYPNQPDWLIFSQLVAQYAQYGLVPVATPTTDVPIMLQRVPRQAETDFAFIKRLAQRNGYVFYIEPATFGVNQAYFGPSIAMSIPQPALTLGQEGHGNISQLNFGNDAMAPVGTKGTFVEPFSKTEIPIPALPTLKVPPLSATPSQARRQVMLRESGNESASRAAVSAVAAVTNSPDSVSANGSLDTSRYGSVLRARKLVGVRGAGFSYDGVYYVKRVTHQIELGKYSQSFSLTREGTGSLSPVMVI
jgi:hypothetical protein